jgi:hypothetical protein
MVLSGTSDAPAFRSTKRSTFKIQNAADYSTPDVRARRTAWGDTTSNTWSYAFGLRSLAIKPRGRGRFDPLTPRHCIAERRGAQRSALDRECGRAKPTGPPLAGVGGFLVVDAPEVPLGHRPAKPTRSRRPPLETRDPVVTWVARTVDKG